MYFWFILFNQFYLFNILWSSFDLFMKELFQFSGFVLLTFVQCSVLRNKLFMDNCFYVSTYHNGNSSKMVVHWFFKCNLFCICRYPVPSVDCSNIPKSECSLAFSTQEESLHYITVTPTVSMPVEFAISVKLAGKANQLFSLV